MDTSLWQTLSSFDFLHSSHKCHVGNTAQQGRLGLFQDADFAGDLEDSKSTSGETLCIFGSRTFVSISWMCKKQTSVSHCSTGSEVISLDAGLRMDGIPAFDLWDLVIKVLHCILLDTPKHREIDRAKRSTIKRREIECGMKPKAPTPTPKRRDTINWKLMSFLMWITLAQAQHRLTPNPICTILKTVKLWWEWSSKAERSPTMRHVSRTHRVALDWLSDRRNLDSKVPNQICWHQKPTRRHVNQR